MAERNESELQGESVKIADWKIYKERVLKPLELLPNLSIIPGMIDSAETIPITTKGLASVLTSTPTGLLVDIMGMATWKRADGYDIVFPVVREGNEWSSVMNYQNVHELVEELSVDQKLVSEQQIKRYWQLDAMVGGGSSAGLVAGRVLTAVALVEAGGSQRQIETSYGLGNGSGEKLGQLQELLGEWVEMGKRRDEVVDSIWLEKNCREHPTMMYVYAVSQLAHLYGLIEKGEIGRDKESLKNHWEWVKWMGEARMHLLNRQDSNADLLAGLSNALSLYKDMLFAHGYPKTAALTERMMRLYVPYAREMRYNNYYLRSAMIPILEKMSVVNPQRLESAGVDGLVVTTKPIYSVAREILGEEQWQKRLWQLASEVGLENLDPEDSIRLMESLIGMTGADHNIWPVAREYLLERNRKYDLLRCRVLYGDENELGLRAAKALGRVRVLRAIMKLFGGRELLERKGHWSEIYLKLVEHKAGVQSEDNKIWRRDTRLAQAGVEIMRRVKELKKDSILYGAVHAKLVALTENGWWRGGNWRGFEVQMRLKELEPMAQLTTFLRPGGRKLEELPRELVERVSTIPN